METMAGRMGSCPCLKWHEQLTYTGVISHEWMLQRDIDDSTIGTHNGSFSEDVILALVNDDLEATYLVEAFQPILTTIGFIFRIERPVFGYALLCGLILFGRKRSHRSITSSMQTSPNDVVITNTRPLVIVR